MLLGNLHPPYNDPKTTQNTLVNRGGRDDGQCICATQLKVNDRMPHDARPWIAATSQNKEEQPAGNKHTQYGV